MIKPVVVNEAMTPREVADLFSVDPKTVTRWAKQGKLPCFKTLGGHRRYPREEIMRLVRVSREQKAKKK